MKVHVAFDISGMKGQVCKAIAYFDYPKGTGLRDKNGRYRTTDGTVSSSTNFTPNYPNSTYSDLFIFIPNSELHLLSGKRTYYTRVFIFAPSGNSLGNSEFATFDGTGSNDSNDYANNVHGENDANNSGSFIKTWREELGYGMFAINQGDPNGARQRTIWRACSVCRGSIVCRNCHGTQRCTICNGQGGIITAGYGNYIPCTACGQSGRCGVCHGTGKCVCSNSEYPGYMPGSTIMIGPDGQVIYNSRDYDSGSSSSSGSSSRSSKGTCSKCGGRRYESTSYQHAAASSSGWMPPYHNSGGSSCPYCNYQTDHYHYPCSECHGYGHN